MAWGGGLDVRGVAFVPVEYLVPLIVQVGGVYWTPSGQQAAPNTPEPPETPPAQPAPTQTRCDCKEQTAALEAQIAALAGRVDRLVATGDKTVNLLGVVQQQAASNTKAIASIDTTGQVDLTGIESQLAIVQSRLAELEQRQITLEIKKDGELVGVSQGRSVVGFDVRSILEEKNNGSN